VIRRSAVSQTDEFVEVRLSIFENRRAAVGNRVATNGSAAYADVDARVAIVLMRNRFPRTSGRSPDWTTSSPRPPRHPPTQEGTP